MYCHGMYCSMYWYVLFLVCFASIGMYWYVLTFDMCRYWYASAAVFVCIVHMVCIKHIDMYWSISILVCIGMDCMQ